MNENAIYVYCDQGTREWEECRIGVATSSCFNKILTPKGALSAQREDYLGQVLCEWVTGEPFEEWQGNIWTEWGKEQEPAAREYYCLESGIEKDGFKQVGFVYYDSAKLIGASPDCLVGDEGLLELKCTMPKNHLLVLFRGEIPKKHMPQLQGQLWVTGREWVDFMSFHPLFPAFVERVYPDPPYQAALESALPQFAGEIEAMRVRAVEELGINIVSTRERSEEVTDITDAEIDSWLTEKPYEAGRKAKPEKDEIQEALAGMDALSAQSRSEKEDENLK